MAKRKQRGAAYANRKNEKASVEIRQRDQRNTILYSVAGILGVVLLCGLLYWVSTLGSGVVANSDDSDSNEGSAIVEETDAMDSEDSMDEADSDSESSELAQISPDVALDSFTETERSDGVASIDPIERNAFYSDAPEMTIDDSKIYDAIIKMDAGDMRLRLFAEQAPITVNSFVYLANEGFYDGVTFHRVIDGFMAQGGDPSGSGSGGPGYSFEDEVDNDLTFDRAGLLAMANSGPATNGSQFFITYDATDWLNGAHTIFGELLSGQDVHTGITNGDVINTIEILVSDG